MGLIKGATMKITKVKSNNGKIEIHYSKRNSSLSSETDEFTLKCADRPLPGFDEALLALRQTVIDICEFTNEDPEKYEVFGVSFSWTDGVMGAVISAKKTLLDSNAPLCINTPHKPSEAYSEGADDSNLLGSSAVTALENLIEEAIKYVDGNRAQGNLFEQKAA